jgi:hypothetical protein
VIHTPNDGKGSRRVLVNGKEVRRCFFADTHRGIADCYRHPIKLNKWKKRALSRRMRGVVVVEPMQ